MAATCSVCANIDLARLPYVPQQIYHGHMTFDSLRNSALQGCGGCQTFVQGLVQQTLEVNPHWSEATAIQKQLEHDRVSGSNIKIWAGPNVRADNNVSLLKGLTLSRVLSGPVDFLLSSANGQHPAVHGRRVQPHIDFKLAKHWIDTCSKNHDRCRAGYVHGKTKSKNILTRVLNTNPRVSEIETQDRMLPSRVVDIGNDSTIPKVLETKKQRGVYCCLSHCWGKEHPTMTTKGNYEEHLVGIPWSALSKTIHDALIAARELGYQYIWIDSLCIIQHDRDDWIREGSQMQDIFEKCAVVIGAAAALNAQSGFLRQRSPLTSAECSFRNGGEDLILGIPAVRLGVESTQPISDRSRRFQDRSRLFTRAWVMQERLLPPRVLYFGLHEMYFECRTLMLQESYWSRIDTLPGNFGGVRNTNMTPLTGWVGNSDPLRLWFEFVGEYTSLALTNWTDRLPAISGLAKRFSNVTGGEYFAGLWGKNLLKQLTWKHMRRGGDGDTGYNPSVFVAPSWS